MIANRRAVWRDARMSSASLPAHLSRALATLPAGAIVVAYSGGMDSHVLVHALARNAQARERGLRALHVDHGLHVDSARWAQHAGRIAAALDVPFAALRIEVDRCSGTGIEDAARSARMQAFIDALHPGEILALAQHRDDQAETVLLKLLRGAGPQGLGGMRTLRDWGRQNRLWRPLLDLPRSSLVDYAQTQALSFIEDPSNADTHLRRNFLRAEILPRLQTRWPDAQAALAHSANWARAAADFIGAAARKALMSLRGNDPAMINCAGWRDLPDALRDLVLRDWLRDLGLDEPAHFHVAELERQLRDSADDRSPCVRFAQTELRRYRNDLYAMRALRPVSSGWQADWHGERLSLPGGGELELVADQPAQVPDARFEAVLQVRFRRGGERLKPAGASHTRELRLLLQEAGVPPWLRDRLPLIYAGEDLIAVADICASEAGAELSGRLGSSVVWKRI
jgi:tRNA(Ile)-lysidine synthase